MLGNAVFIAFFAELLNTGNRQTFTRFAVELLNFNNAMKQMFLVIRYNVIFGRNVENTNVFSFALAYFHSHNL